MRDYQIKFDSWLASAELTPGERSELKALSDLPGEIAGRFSSDLAFGTGGLRGRMMLGSAAINIYTVAQATQGLAQYINTHCAGDAGDAPGAPDPAGHTAAPACATGPAGVPCVWDNLPGGDASAPRRRSVVIAFDSRNNSREFAHTAASVLAGNRIHVYIFEDIRPTPELSFAIRYLSCVAGINITASHNPKEYNGYKAYWSDGAQLAPEQADAIADCMHRVDIWRDVRREAFDTALNNGHITIIGSEIDEVYIDTVISQSVNREAIPKAADSLSVVYTPLHGTGYRLIPETLRRVGIKRLYMVPGQSTPDGDFPTLAKPNPEYPESYALAIPIADGAGCDLIIATDPDADRVGVMARGRDGHFRALTGNQTGSLLLYYIISAYKSNGDMPPEPYAVKTIVTTELMTKICRAGGVELYNVLTGFKYIGEVIKKKESEGRGSFIFGAEESYGYLKGTHARDKDAVVSAMLICEMAAAYRARGMTLIDALDALYSEYGFSLEVTDEFAFEGYDGSERMRFLMRSLRDNPLETISGRDVLTISDYLAGVVTDIPTSTPRPTGLPSSDVLRWELEGSDVIIVRPSGTEPKLKVYYLLDGRDEDSARAKLAGYRAALDEIIRPDR